MIEKVGYEHWGKTGKEYEETKNYSMAIWELWVSKKSLEKISYI